MVLPTPSPIISILSHRHDRRQKSLLFLRPGSYQSISSSRLQYTGKRGAICQCLWPVTACLHPPLQVAEHPQDSHAASGLMEARHGLRTTLQNSLLSHPFLFKIKSTACGPYFSAINNLGSSRESLHIAKVHSSLTAVNNNMAAVCS